MLITVISYWTHPTPHPNVFKNTSSSDFVFLLIQFKKGGKVNLGLNVVIGNVSGGANFKEKVSQKLTLSKKAVKTMGRQIKEVQKALDGFTHRMIIMRLNTRRLLRELKMLISKKVFAILKGIS